MKELKEEIYQQLSKSAVMQLATNKNDKPWLASVYFVVDKDLNFYWLSEKDRRHSLELIDNPNASIAIVVKSGIPVAGIQAEGKAYEVKSLKEIVRVMAIYTIKYNVGFQFVKNFKKGINKHRLYKFSPKIIKLTDESKYGFDKGPIFESDIFN